MPQGEERNIYGFPFYAKRNERQKIVIAMNKLLKK